MLTFIIWVMNLVKHLTFIKQIRYMCIHIAGYSLHMLHVSETVGMGQGNSLCYLQIYTNLPIKNKTLPSWVAF
jgi:hypothetical protein